MTRHGKRGFYSTRRHYAYAQVNDEEYTVLKVAAQKDGLSISDFVRRCVNSYLLEQGDEGLLLETIAAISATASGSGMDDGAASDVSRLLP